MNFRLGMICGFLVIAAAFGAGAQARDMEMGGDNQFPYSIMAPEPGTTSHHRTSAAHRIGRGGVPHALTPLAERAAGSSRYAARGTPGVVLPTPLPRTKLIPPEGSGTVTIPSVPHEQGPTFVPGAPSLGGVSNLPHGPETFQDRASRCAFQQGLYGVPGTASNQYMGACLQ